MKGMHMDQVVSPLLRAWEGPFGLPAFEHVNAEHFPAAFELAIAEHRSELASIAAQDAPADFDNTLARFDAAGRWLTRTEALFHNLTASNTSPALQAVQRDMAAPLAAHWSSVFQDQALFERIAAIHRQLDGPAGAALSAEQRRLVERVHLDFVRSGAQLPAVQRHEYDLVMQRLAELTTAFAQNVLHDESTWLLELPDEADRVGLPASVLATAHQAAVERKATSAYAITLSRSSILPFLAHSERRDLRQRAWQAWVGRGENDGEHDNRGIAREILELRREQARLLGYASFADYALADTMARSRDRVWALLDEVWQRGCAALELEREMLLQTRREQGGDLTGEAIEAWDWRFWAERTRLARFALDDAEIKPYFALPNLVEALFDCAQRLFGLRFIARPDIRSYHDDVLAYEVRAADDRVVGLFLQDNYARPAKRSGAWMSSLSWRHRNGFESLPVILNNNNFARGGDGEPALLSLDDARTLFHEFGHGLHGLLSDVSYERLSGTQVLRDFVELPSQLFEHWITERQVLARHARHWQTGAPIPDALVDRIEAARRFGEAYETVRYTASAIVDMAAHESAQPVADISAFERDLLSARGLPPGVGLNHRLAHFQHLFSGSGYAAGYYVYLWAEVLDADAYDAFVEAGDPFDGDVAQRLLRCIYASGDSVEPGAAYREFRGRDAKIEPMLRGRGLID
jgi:peptidyl-dipeptidase Dcp